MRTLILSKGAHKPGSGQGCLMELVSFLAAEKWSDSPVCTSPVIAAYVRALNDRLPDDERQRMLSFAPRLIGTVASEEIESKRMFLCADRAVRVFAPKALRAAGLTDEAEKLAALPEIVDSASARNAATHAYAAAAESATCAAAYAANYAASAADAATYAADTADAADAATYATSAAAYAASAYAAAAAALQLLEDLIALGPGGAIPDDWLTRAMESPCAVEATL